MTKKYGGNFTERIAYKQNVLPASKPAPTVLVPVGMDTLSVKVENSSTEAVSHDFIILQRNNTSIYDHSRKEHNQVPPF